MSYKNVVNTTQQENTHSARRWTLMHGLVQVSLFMQGIKNEESHGFYLYQYLDSIAQVTAQSQGFLNFLPCIKCDTWRNPCINVHGML